MQINFISLFNMFKFYVSYAKLIIISTSYLKSTMQQSL